MSRLRSALPLFVMSSFVAVFMLALPLPAAADSQPRAAEDTAPEALPWRDGPEKIALGHGAKLALPAEYAFLGPPHASKLMEKLGNLHTEGLLGIVVPVGAEPSYLVTLRYDEAGYIKDDESLDAAELLQAIQGGEEEYNAERKKAGFPPLHADGWQERPRYEKSLHQVIWGLAISTPESSSVNYNTRVLGRKGYVSVNLVTDAANLATDKQAASVILAGTTFDSGLRYQDFDESNDKVAEYGLTGLVLGGAGLGVAKLVKIGLLAKFGKVLFGLLLAGKKVILGLLLAGAAFARRLFGRKRDESEA